MSRLTKRFLVVLLVWSLLPLPMYGVAELAPPQDQPSIAYWTRSQFYDPVTVTDTVIVEQEVILSDRAMLDVDGGHLVIAPEAAFYGDIVLSGDGALLEIEGAVHGNIRITSANAHVMIAGNVFGTLTLDGLGHTRNQAADVLVEISQDGYVRVMMLAGVGYVGVQGTVDLVDSDPANAATLYVNGGTVGTLYARSDAQYDFLDEARAGTIYLDGLECTYEKQGYLANLRLFDTAHADTIVVDAGFVDIFNGSTVDTLYLYGKGIAHIDQGFKAKDEAWPTGYALLKAHVSKVIQVGRQTHCMSRGHIGFHYVEEGLADSAGYTEMLVAARAHVIGRAGGYFADEDEKDMCVDLFDTFFTQHYGTLICLNGSLDMNEGTIIGELLMDGGNLVNFHAAVETLVLDASVKRVSGSIASDARIGTLISSGKADPTIQTTDIGRGVLPNGDTIGISPQQTASDRPEHTAVGGESAEKAVPLADGEFFVDAISGSQWFAVPCDAYTAFTLTADACGGYGVVVIRTPDGDWRLLDLSGGAQTVSLLNEAAGTYEVRLIGASGTEGFVLRLQTEPPLRIDYTLKERSAAAEGEAPTRVDGDIRQYAVSIYSETTGKPVDGVTYGEGVMLAMPDSVSPGDMLTLSLRKKDGTIQPYAVAVTLDERRHAAAVLEGTTRGQYEAKLSDTYRAHLYLYGGDGAFLREIFPKEGAYATGALDAGTYHIAMIRAGVGGWKMLHVNAFEANGLIDGEHYLLDSFTLADGVMIRREDVKVPEEPALQSEWLDTERTGYQARVSSVVKGGLALMAFEWSLAGENMEDVAAEITFLPGAAYVDGSAAIDGQVVGASWENGVLRVPLEKSQGKLLFYVEGDGSSDALVSNASIVFTADGQPHAQYVGSAQTRIVPLSIHGPTLVSGSSVTLYGYTSPYSVAYIYENGIQIGSALSDADGLWSANLALSKDQRHLLTVGTGEEGVISEPIEVYRAAGAPVLEHFALHYIEHGVSKKISVEGGMFGRTPIKFAYEPGTDLTFVLQVDNDAYVDTLMVVAEMNGQRETMQAKRDQQSGDWVAVGQFTKDQMFAPDLFAIEYTFREDVLDAVFQESFVSIPLLDTLYAAADLSGVLPLTRYYMASPTLQKADVGFGPGWFTAYSVFASAYDENGMQQLMLWSPEGARLFTGEKGRYTEDAGYATARVDAKGLITVTEADGSTMTFDAGGKLITVLGSYGRKTTFTYDEQDRLTSVTSGEQSLLFAYGKDGLIESASLGDEIVTYRYANGHLTGADGPSGHASYTYDGLFTAAGQHPLTCAQDAAGALRIRYDDEGKPISFDQDGEVTDIAYANGKVTMRDGAGTTEYALDENGQCTRITYEDGAYEEHVMAAEGTLLRAVWADGRTAETLYSPCMEPLWHKDENGHVVRFAYDKAGNLMSVTDGNGNETRYAYDKAGNLTRITHADGTSERYTYNDRDGSIASYTDRAGQKTAYTYDRQGNLTRVTYADRTATEYFYDEEERLTSIQEGDQHAWIDYSEGNARYYGFEDGRGVYLDWDDYTGSVFTGSDELGTSSLYENDRLDRVESWQYGTLTHQEYDKQGRLIRETRANGTYTAYTYENDRLTCLENYGADGALHSYFGQTWDAAGNIVRHEAQEGIWQYGYDAVGQLTRIIDPNGAVTEYVYDAAGNRVSETVDGEVTVYETNALNQYTRVGDVTYSYDKNGRLTRREGPDGMTEFGWDARGRLISVDNGATRTEYAYDVFGNRSTVTVNGVTTHYTVAPAELPYAARSEADGVEAYYHNGPNGLVASELEGQLWYYSFTPLGSVSEITDADGNLLRQYAYDPFGHVTGQTVHTAEIFDNSEALAALEAAKELEGDDAASAKAIEEAEALVAERIAYAEAVARAAEATAANPFTYVGRYGIMDDGNGLLYMRARYTAQDISRFISPDPAGQEYDMNLYRYAKNNVKTYVDASGRSPISSETAGSLANRPGSSTPSGWGSGETAGSLANRPGSSTPSGWGSGETAGSLANLPDSGSSGPIGRRPGKVTGGAAPINPNLDWDDVMGSSPVDSAVDPSGYVYEAVHSNRVESVTATCYYRDDEGRAVQWNAEEYSQQNPQVTDHLGQYAWYVPAGEWKVIYEKEGYEPLETAWLPVPPPQTEVNMGMVSYSAPKVAHAALYADGAEITFTKYMDIDSVLQHVSLATTDGNQIPVTVSAINAEPMAGNEDRLLASRFRLAIEGGAVEAAVLTVGEGAFSYTGTPAESCQVELVRVWRLDGFGLQTEYQLIPHETQQITLLAEGEGKYTQLSLMVTVNTDAEVTVDGISPFGDAGNAIITVTAGDAGKATLSVVEESTGLTATVLLTVKPAEESALYQAVIHTKSDQGLNLWDSPAKKTASLTIAKGETVDVIAETEGGWVMVRYQDSEGYVDGRYLVPVK